MTSPDHVNKDSEANTNMSSDVNPYTSCVNNLSRGILDIYSSPLNTVEKQLKELTVKQNFLITQIHDENINLAQVQYDPDIQEIFNKMRVYHTKLLNIKKDMKLVYERTTKLKKRALRLQHAKEKGELKPAGEKQSEIIIGQPGSSSS